MLIKPPADIPSSEITDKKLYLNRREFIRAAAGDGARRGDRRARRRDAAAGRSSRRRTAGS